MTVIAGAITDDGVVIAADSQVTTGNFKSAGVKKVWATDQFILGWAGIARASQVVQYETDWPVMTQAHQKDPERFAVVSLVPAIEEVLKKRNYELKDLDLLVGTPGNHLLRIEYGFVEVADQMTIGSGRTEALGALGMVGPWSEKDVIESVRRACASNTGCSLPMTVGNARDLRVYTVED